MRSEAHIRSTIRIRVTDDNHLLACLPRAVRTLWAPHLETVELDLGQVLTYEAGRPEYVYFPLTAIVSLLYVLQDGQSAEIAIIGNEGMVGFALFMGGDTTLSRAVVQSSGKAFRMKAQFMKHEFNLVAPVMHLMLRFTQALIAQMAQTAICNRHHSIDQQLCRWLLISIDRLQGISACFPTERRLDRNPNLIHGRFGIIQG
jgi:CRP-like cAMP-binding protein